MDGKIQKIKDKVDVKLILRQIFFFILISIFIALSVINVLEERISLILSLSGFISASIVGFVLSRIFKIFWHQEKGKVVSRLDSVGVVFLAIYIAIEFGRDWIFGHWLSGPVLTSFGLIILAGLLLGRFLGTLLKINQILNDDNT